MKGLILKDLYSVRFQIILGMLISIFPAFILFCMTLGYANGDGREEGEWFVTFCFALLNYCTVVIGSSFCVDTVREDVSCGWIGIANTMPLSVKKICLGKILSSFIVVIIITAMTSVPNIFALIMGVGSREVLIAAPICSMLLQMTVMSPVFPFALRFGGNKASPFYICLLIAVIIGLAAGIMAGFKSGALEPLRPVFYLVLPVFALASVTLSLLASRKMLVHIKNQKKQ